MSKGDVSFSTILVKFLLSPSLLCYVGVRDLCLSLASTIAWLIETLIGSEVYGTWDRTFSRSWTAGTRTPVAPADPIASTIDSYFDGLKEGDLIHPITQPSETGPEDESRRQKQLTQLMKLPLELARQELSLGR